MQAGLDPPRGPGGRGAVMRVPTSPSGSWDVHRSKTGGHTRRELPGVHAMPSHPGHRTQTGRGGPGCWCRKLAGLQNGAEESRAGCSGVDAAPTGRAVSGPRSPGLRLPPLQSPSRPRDGARSPRAARGAHLPHLRTRLHLRSARGPRGFLGPTPPRTKTAAAAPELQAGVAVPSASPMLLLLLASHRER